MDSLETLPNEVYAAPSGLYGVWCEPVGHDGNPQWYEEYPKKEWPYEEAIQIADKMCRCNKLWNYSAKPRSRPYRTIKILKLKLQLERLNFLERLSRNLNHPSMGTSPTDGKLKNDVLLQLESLDLTEEEADL
jgi:hypothetical protein